MAMARVGRRLRVGIEVTIDTSRVHVYTLYPSDCFAFDGMDARSRSIPDIVAEGHDWCVDRGKYGSSVNP